MNKIDPKDTRFIYFRESAVQSIIADCTSFGFILGGLLFNHKLLNGDWFVDIFFMIIFFIVSASKANNKAQIFTNMEELKKYLDNPKNKK
jgi:hypothetical protein